MGTRTYSLTFNAPATIELGAGRFFFIKSATAALTLETNGDKGSPVRFDNVGAGLKYKAPLELRWRTLRITSAAIQTVEIVLSDDAEVDIANTVTVSGSVTVQEQPSTTLTPGAKAALAAAASLDIAANAARRRISISNWASSGGGGTVCVRDQAATADAGVELQPGQTMEFQTVAALRVRNNGAAAADISYLEES